MQTRRYRALMSGHNKIQSDHLQMTKQMVSTKNQTWETKQISLQSDQGLYQRPFSTLVFSVYDSSNKQKDKTSGALLMLWPCHQTPSVSVPDYHWLTQAQTPTLSRNILFLSPPLHPSFNNMHKQIQSELKSLPAHCPPYGPRKKEVLAFNFHSCTFIRVHEYANATVPVAITMRPPTGRCQHCQGR